MTRHGPAPEDEVRAHVLAASPLSRRLVGHYLRAWPEFEAFVVDRGVLVEPA